MPRDHARQYRIGDLLGDLLGRALRLPTPLPHVVSFVIAMAAFSMMLFVQLGPVMEGYWDQVPAFISLFRALFGDFDIGPSPPLPHPPRP